MVNDERERLRSGAGIGDGVEVADHGVFHVDPDPAGHGDFVDLGRQQILDAVRRHEPVLGGEAAAIDLDLAHIAEAAGAAIEGALGVEIPEEAEAVGLGLVDRRDHRRCGGARRRSEAQRGGEEEENGARGFHFGAGAGGASESGTLESGAGASAGSGGGFS